ncbi:hypothetical protein ACPUVO_15645 [Pseudocolwellia sp. HL-MZ19]|uniref:hypothetical protein n=1 Tax=Pseudocolwellia sp. HL-MZ19 TaxID=3400846 RepID=UPI003CF2ECCD
MEVLKKKLVPETLAFTSWFIIKYPSFIKDEDLNLMHSNAKLNGRLPDVNDKKAMRKAIDLMRCNEFGVDNLELNYGL